MPDSSEDFETNDDLPGLRLSRPARCPGYALRLEIKYVALHLEHSGELIEQIVGRLAAIVFEVIQVGRRKRLAVAIFDQRRHLFLAQSKRLAPFNQELSQRLHRGAGMPLMLASL